jgi:hypothetical protein
MFDELPGSFDTCEICWWEDDIIQLRNPIDTTASNEKSLVEWQQEILETYPLTVEVAGEFHRDVDWRPIREDEIPQPEDIPEEGLDYFYMKHDDKPIYYWQRN